MACACKAKKSGQVSAVKQVIKKTNVSTTPKAISKNVGIKRVLVKRPI